MGEDNKGKVTAIGIDLGTTYSCVAVWRRAKVEVIPNDQGNRTTPSCVAFTQTQRLLGDAAKNQATVNPSNTIFESLNCSLVVPFLRLGESICGSSHFPLTSDALKKVFTGQASTEVLLSIVHAMVGWLFVAPFILPLLYVLLFPCFKVLVRRFKPKEAELRSEA